MNTTATDIPAIDAVMTYAINDGTVHVNETMADGDMSRKRQGAVEDRTVTVRNGRYLRDGFDIEKQGFVFVDHPTAMKDFLDADELKSVYYAEVEALVKKETGAKRVVVFDHTLRSGDEGERTAKHLREPVTRVHNDYTEWSGPQRVRDVLPDEADDLLTRRFAIVQVWRAIRNPIESHPLGICDARTLAAEDLVIAERRYPNRVGQTYQIAWNPAHEWFYFPHMARDEALVFKVFDSATDGRARFTAHSAFVDPTSPPDAAPRESIEARTFAFF